MKTVVIPSDFSERSIQVAEMIAADSSEKVKILFTHLFHVADDIQDLLFSTYRKKEYDLVPKWFWEECATLKNLFPNKVQSIKIEFFYGSRLASFKNFLEYNKADYIAIASQHGIPPISKSSIDALPVIKKCGLPVVDMDMVREAEYSNELH